MGPSGRPAGVRPFGKSPLALFSTQPTMTQDDQYTRIAVFAAYGAVYGASGYFDDLLNGDEGVIETMAWKHFGKTVLLGVIAGVIAAARGEELEPGAIEGAMVIAVPVTDKLINAFARYYAVAEDAVDDHL